MKNLEDAITIHYNKMSKTDKKIFETIMSDPEKFVRQSIHDAAVFLDLSSPTILRAVKKIGYSGYPEFKLALESFLNNKGQEKPTAQHSIFHEIIETYERSFTKIKDLNLENEIIEAVEWMLDATDVKCLGYGNTGLAAQQLVYSLYSQGVFFEAVTDEVQVRYLTLALKKDCLYIIYSVTGLNEYNHFFDAASKIGAKTILITMNKEAEISSKASKTFILPAASTFLREDGSLRQVDVRLELFLFSEIISYYYNWISDQREENAK